jgi:hypothetical protein
MRGPHHVAKKFTAIRISASRAARSLGVELGEHLEEVSVMFRADTAFSEDFLSFFVGLRLP